MLRTAFRRTFATAPAPPPSSAAATYIPSTPIRLFREVGALRAWRRARLLDGRAVGLVPTMGALHEGHLALVRQAARDNHDVVVSIYVNPAQFGIKEDLASYPVTWEADCAKLAQLDRELAAASSSGHGRVTAVFAPSTAEMYPSGFPGQEVGSAGSFVTITPAGSVLEGKSRPTFFRGVATVCMKLFGIVQPERAYFGQKDVQQTVVVRRMVRDFWVPTEIVVGPTARDADGLALSSRNVYLGPRRRAVANVMFRAFRAAAARYRAGDLARDRILGPAHDVVRAQLADEARKPPEARVAFEVDYFSLADPDTLVELDGVDPDRGAILSGAIKMLPVEKPREGEDLGHSGGPPVRLIDNVILKPHGQIS